MGEFGRADWHQSSEEECPGNISESREFSSPKKNVGEGAGLPFFETDLLYDLPGENTPESWSGSNFLKGSDAADNTQTSPLLTDTLSLLSSE